MNRYFKMVEFKQVEYKFYYQINSIQLAPALEQMIRWKIAGKSETSFRFW